MSRSASQFAKGEPDYEYNGTFYHSSDETRKARNGQGGPVARGGFLLQSLVDFRTTLRVVICGCPLFRSARWRRPSEMPLRARIPRTNDEEDRPRRRPGRQTGVDLELGLVSTPPFAAGLIRPARRRCGPTKERWARRRGRPTEE